MNCVPPRARSMTVYFILAPIMCLKKHINGSVGRLRSCPRAFVTAMLLALVTCQSGAANDLATNRAFDALLSLPAAQPEEGDWGREAPPGFDREDSSEEQLIRWLRRQKRDGADFNATRHQGSLLHHAVRSGLEE